MYICIKSQNWNREDVIIYFKMKHIAGPNLLKLFPNVIFYVQKYLYVTFV